MRLRLSLYTSVLLIFAAGFTCRAQDIQPGQDAPDSTAIKASILADQIIDEARTHLGTPYSYGSKGPRSFDCSGFTRYVFSKFGYDLAPNSASQAGQGRRVSGHIGNLQKGDLVFFSGRSGRGRVGHVGIFIEADESGDGFRFIHAAVHGGVKVSNVKEQYYASRFLGASRIIPDFGSRLSTQTDSVYVEPILADSVDYVVAVRDTLTLGEKDRRILLLSDGSWAYVSPEGEVSRPDSTLRIVLTPDGRWTAADVTLKQLPVIKELKPADSTSVQQAARTSVQNSTNSEAVYHTIRSGDTLYSIAKKYGTNVSKLCRLNNIKSTQVLRIGRKLRVK